MPNRLANPSPSPPRLTIRVAIQEQLERPIIIGIARRTTGGTSGCVRLRAHGVCCPCWSPTGAVPRRVAVRVPIIVRMRSVDRLRERVLEEYGQMNLPSWADPHPGMSAPADESTRESLTRSGIE